MQKGYKNKAIAPDSSPEPEQEYFFPKHNPPVTIKAANSEEAERKLAALDNKKEQ